MISCKIIGRKGRFGNQIFQFASGLGIARKIGADFKIPSTGHRLRQCFKIPDNFFLPAKEITTTKLYREGKTGLKNQVTGFYPELFQIEDGTDLNGYFQSEKYFIEIRQELLEYFQFKDELQQKADALWSQINPQGDSVVSIHVRRGDYIGLGFPICPKTYYESACLMFHDSRFFIFSNDPKWCHSVFTKENETIVNSGGDLLDFILMNKCDHHIIANSTFSWWAAWLSQSGGKVIAPKRWLNRRFEDIYCKDWIVI